MMDEATRDTIRLKRSGWVFAVAVLGAPMLYLAGATTGGLVGMLLATLVDVGLLIYATISGLLLLPRRRIQLLWVLPGVVLLLVLGAAVAIDVVRSFGLA